jgi:serine/threonine protein kinase
VCLRPLLGTACLQGCALLLQEVQGNGYLSKAADTYSLGVLLWEMFHGMPPYAASNGQLVANTCFPRFDLSQREDAPFSYVVVALACLSEDFEKRCAPDTADALPMHCRCTADALPMLCRCAAGELLMLCRPDGCQRRIEASCAVAAPSAHCCAGRP